MSQPKSTVVQNLPIDSLISAKYNPKSRIKGIKGLCGSIEEVGLLIPLLVSPAPADATKHNVIEGHRRLFACRKLGWTEIPCLPTAGDPAKIYAHANGFSKKHTGNESLNVWLKKPTAVTSFLASRLVEAEEIIGRGLLVQLAKSGRSLTTYKVAKQLATQADSFNSSLMKKIVRWCLQHGTDSLSKAMAAGTSSASLLRAIESNRPLRLTYAVGGRKLKTATA